jgi:hypothetical protein
VQQRLGIFWSTRNYPKPWIILPDEDGLDEGHMAYRFHQRQSKNMRFWVGNGAPEMHMVMVERFSATQGLVRFPSHSSRQDIFDRSTRHTSRPHSILRHAATGTHSGRVDAGTASDIAIDAATDTVADTAIDAPTAAAILYASIGHWAVQR